MFDRKIFIKNVEELVRIYCGGSQKEFGKRIKDRDAVSKWKGGVTPSLEVLLRIPEIFGCSLDWLLLDIDHNNPRSKKTSAKIIDFNRRKYDSVNKEIKLALGIDPHEDFYAIMGAESKERTLLIEMVHSLAEKAREFKRLKKAK